MIRSAYHTTRRAFFSLLAALPLTAAKGESNVAPVLARPSGTDSMSLSTALARARANIRGNVALGGKMGWNAYQEGILLPPGIYNAGDFAQAGGNLYLRASVPGSVIVRVPDDKYFMTLSGNVSNIHVSGIRFVGGKGAIKLTNQGNNVAGMMVVEDCYFDNYTECAIGNNATDAPNLKINRCMFAGATAGGTIGVAWGGYYDSLHISDCEFLRNRYHLKLGDRLGGNATIDRCGFIAFAPSGLRQADIWIVPSTTANGVNAGVNTIFRENKFGNENMLANDARILIAAEDASDPTKDRLARWHLDKTYGEGDQQFVDGFAFEGNCVSASGHSIAPFIRSHISNVRRLRWARSNIFDGASHTYLLEYLEAERVPPAARLIRDWDVELGRHSPGRPPFTKAVCNRPVALIADPLGAMSGHLRAAGDGAWDGQHLVMGGYHLWVSSAGALRIKNGAPTSDADGAVVGAQA